MKKPLLCAGVGVSVASAVLAATPAFATDEMAPLIMAGEGGVPDSYVVTVDQGVDPTSVADELGLPVEHSFTHVLNGFTTTVDPTGVYRARFSDDIREIEQVREYRLDPADNEQRRTPWGLDRIDQGRLPLDGRYSVRHDGRGITAYVIDSGIAPNHPEFEGRARIGFDATGGDGFDGNSHGTHAAGIIGSKSYGVAKKIRLVGVKVLDDRGRGTTGSVLAGLEWVAKHAKKPAVANMSIGGPKDPTINEAAHNLVTEFGVFLAASAGNWGGDANTVSPASADGVFAVAASNPHDEAGKFTNHGEIIDCFAPGVNIMSTIPGAKTQSRWGTASATAFATGAAGLFLQAHPRAKPGNIVAGLRNRAAKDVIRNAPEETTTDLLQVRGL